ncbi:DUF2627 domain-containing protein [Neobacillus mesonae]|nr:DUF2627 domain-containing protein [Neobacillus mesonae]
MRLMLSRFIAIIILVIPGLGAMKGFLMMKDSLFHYYAEHGNEQVTKPAFEWFSFSLGLLLFGCCMAFLGGWILFRDRKRNYVGPRFKQRQNSDVSS